MSAAQGSQWVRRSSPSSKQGPMRATLPMSFLTRQNSNLKKSNSPSLSPTSPWKTGVSPDQNLSGVRSPGAINYKAKCKTLASRTNHDYINNSVMRRTASLDTIYLTGQWPRETLYLYSSNLQVDRSTQTDEWLGEARKNYRYQDQANEDKLDKYIRHRRTAKDGSSRERTAAFTLLGGGSASVGEQSQQRHRMRSSIEGLNQEIERLVLKSGGVPPPTEAQERKPGTLMTPEGHRAPVADLLRQTRSVNTQTPAAAYSTQSSGPPSRDSGSPLVSNNIDSRPSSELRGGSEDSSPENEGRNLGTSPRINRFLAREPPDGCERVSLRFTEDTRKPMVDISAMDYPLKPSMNFQLKPSLGSAFHPPRALPEPTTQ